jgi:hypothetical protein
MLCLIHLLPNSYVVCHSVCRDVDYSIRTSGIGNGVFGGRSQGYARTPTRNKLASIVFFLLDIRELASNMRSTRNNVCVKTSIHHPVRRSIARKGKLDHEAITGMGIVGISRPKSCNLTCLSLPVATVNRNPLIGANALDDWDP